MRKPPLALAVHQAKAGARQGHSGAAPAAPKGRAFVNARILPMGPPRDGKPGWDHEAQAILWQGDTILAVGSNDAIRAEARRHGIDPEDLAGRIVLPGFVDAHTHFLHVGVKRTRPDLGGAKSMREALGRVATFLRDHPGASHVIAEGWDESEWSVAAGSPAGPDGLPRRPTRHDVDAVVAAAAKDGSGPIDRPVVLRRICGHIAVASTGALPAIRAHWDDDATVDLDTGQLTEAPSLYLNEVLASTPQELDRAVQKACSVAHRLGVTTVGDYSQAPYRAALQRAAARGDLSVRVASSVYVQQLAAEVAAGMRTGRPGLGPKDVAGGSSPWLRDGGLKVFLDGSLGGHTAHLREPYLDEPHHEHGSRIWSDDDLDRFFGTAHAHGIQVHAHAIGDAAIDQGLDAFARLAAREDLEGGGWRVEAMPRRPDEGGHGALGDEGTGSRNERSGTDGTALRHRFEHYEIVHDDQVARTVELGIVASSQPNFVGEWSAKGGMYEARLGARYRVNNRFRAFLDAGISLAFGSDGMPFGPLVGLQSAVEHPDPTQRLSPAQAIWHYTTAAAWSLHWDDAVGALLPGHKADLVVLDRKDLSGTPTTWILRETIAGGQRQGGNDRAIPSL